MTHDEEDALRAARDLIAFGVPVFAAPPALDAHGEWDPAGGTGKTGYVFPPAWQKTVPTENWLDPTAPGWADRAWRPGWALGAVMGHGFDLLDVDPRNGGLETRQELVEAGAWPTCYGLAVTPSGGWHEFISSLGVASRDDLRPGLDVKAGMPDGQGRGFAFIAPTVKRSKENGEIRPYRWLKPPARPANDETGASIRELLSVARAASKPREGEADDGPSDLGTPILHGHDKELSRRTASLVSRGFSRTEAWQVAQAWIRDDVVGGDPNWPFTERDFDRWWKGAHAKFAPSEPRETGAPLGFVGAPSEPREAEGPRPTFLDWHALASTPQEDIDWLVPGIIAPKRGHVLYAPTGIGKSLITLEWCVGMVRRGLTVLYVDHENDPRGDVWDRLCDMDVGPHELAGLRYLSFPEMSPLDTPAGGAELLAIAQEVAPDITVVDTATRTVKGEENSNDTWTAWDRYTGVQLRKLGIAFLRIDHSGKNIERGQRGGSNKSTDADLVWQLAEVKKDEEYALTNEKARIKVPEKVIQLRRLRDPLRHEKIPVPTALEKEAIKLRGIWAQMDEAGADVNPLTDGGVPKGVIKIRNEMRAFGISGSDGNLKAVAEARWAHLHNYPPAPRPEWAPPLPDLTISEESA